MFTSNKFAYQLVSVMILLSLIFSGFQPLGVSAQGTDSMDVTAVDNAAPVRELVLVNAQKEKGGISLHFNQIDTAWGRAEHPNNVQALAAPAISSKNPNDNEGIGAGHFVTGNIPALAPVTWYVATTGNDSNTCTTTGSPCLTINGAIGKATDGDMIMVATGTYTGSGTEVVLVNKSVTLSGGWNASFATQSGKSTIDGQGARQGVIVNSNAIGTIEHFNVQNGNATTGSGSSLQGGGIYNSGTLILNNSIIKFNMAQNGGGISNGGGSSSDIGNLILNNSTISDNSASDSGGGIYNYIGTVTVNNSTVNDNKATNAGGGIMNFCCSAGIGGTAILNNSTISSNQSSRGGGILNAGTLSVSNSTISSNVATGSLGFGGGGINTGGVVTAQNTIVAGNLVSLSVPGPDCLGTVGSGGYNLIGNNSNCTFNSTTGDLVGTSGVPIVPRLTPLQDNGGPTLTHGLMSGSPAIDNGNPVSPGSGGNSCLTNDQRDIARPVGVSCDIGAFEGEATVNLATLIKDPSFEAFTPNPYWSESSFNFGTPLCMVATCGTGNGSAGPHTGSAWGWLGGVLAPNYESASLSQNVIIPTTAYSLQFYFWIGAVESGSTASDAFTAKIDGVPVFTANATQKGLYPNYTLVGVNIHSSFADGGVHTLTFSSSTVHLVNFNLDDVAFSVFTDVPSTHPYYNDIQILYANGYTGGCSSAPLLFCPDVSMSRAQGAVFMMRGNYGSGYTPPTPVHFFKDNWKKSSWGEGWAEGMFNVGLTAGCSPSPLKFCPDDILTNVQIAVFGLRLKYGNGYQPPAGTGSVFADMTDVNFWGTGWAEQAYADGLIPACGTSGGKPKFCPNALVTRGFGASVIVKAKNLTMP